MKTQKPKLKTGRIDSAISNRICEIAETWLCDSYSMDTRFIAECSADGTYRLLSATVLLTPIPHTVDNGFQQFSGGLYVGQKMESNVPKQQLVQAIHEAISGTIHVYDKKLILEQKQAPDFYSESLRRDLWFYALHLRISGDRVPTSAYVDSFIADNALRNASVPFDGVADLASWLGVADPTTGQDQPSITFRMNPPADLSLVNCKLSAGKLELKIFAHPKLDKRKIGVAIRSVPGKGLAARCQIGESIKWARVKNGIRVGTIVILLEAADQALAILSIDGAVVRRQWFLDASRARNQRLIAVQQFDSDLRMIKREVLNPSTSDRFELGVAALLFLMGFSPVVQIETDSPDIIVATPEGRLAIVECTTRVADSALKIGKLVDRRGALTKTLNANDHPALVLSILVCALPKDQIAIKDDELLRNKIVLLCKEDIATALEQLRFPKNPDQIFVDAETNLLNTPKFPS